MLSLLYHSILDSVNCIISLFWRNDRLLRLLSTFPDCFIYSFSFQFFFGTES